MDGINNFFLGSILAGINQINNSKKYALCTVTDDTYAFCTYVMIHSFLDKNMSWFDGDIHIFVEKELSNESYNGLMSLYDKIIINVVDCEKYNNALNHLRAYSGEIYYKEDDFYNAYGRYWPHMLKFEVFGVEGYDRVFFIDSDMLILDDIQDFVDNEHDFVICEDLTEEPCFSIGKQPHIWDKKTYLNSGIFSIKKTDENFVEQLIKICEGYVHDQKSLGQCVEQDAINIFLTDKDVIVFPLEYNAVQNFYRDTTGRKITSEKIIHYFTAIKPWYGKFNGYDYIHSVWRDVFYGYNFAKLNYV